MWFWVWAFLVVATLVGAFFLGRRLWRSGRTLLRELSAASEALGATGERVSAAVDAAALPDTTATMFEDPATLHGRVDARRRERVARRGDRLVRHRVVWQRWVDEGWPPARR